MLKEDDTNKALLGYNYMLEKKVFDKPLELGDKFEINNVPFEVVGFITEVGNPTDDSNLYITKEAFELLNPDSTDKYGFVLVSTAQGEDPEELADKIADKLRKRKDQKEGEEDFSVESFSDLLETFATFIDIINGILLLIALIHPKPLKFL